MVDALTCNMKEWSLADMGKLRSGVEAAIPTAKQRKQYRAKKHVVLHVEACSHSFLHCASLYVRSTNLSPRVCYIVKVRPPFSNPHKDMLVNIHASKITVLAWSTRHLLLPLLHSKRRPYQVLTKSRTKVTYPPSYPPL